MTNKAVEITNEDLLLEIGKLYIQNTYKDKLINELHLRIQELEKNITGAKEQE